MAEKKTLYLVDGTALVYRSYFAFIRNPLVNSRGEDTSATFGFTNTLLKLIRERKPDYLGVAFDAYTTTFRHQKYPDYKATRQKMADGLVDQLPRTREAVDALGARYIEVDEYEADDVIGTLARCGQAAGLEVYLVTGDKDFMQLVGDGIRMYVPAKEKEEIVGPDEVRGKTGVPPEMIVDLMGLTGDASDNIPGVPKVGPKTALALLERFGSLDDVLARREEIDKPSIRAAVEEHRDLALLSRDLATIRTNVPMDCSLESLRYGGIPGERAAAFFREMEFTSLMDTVRKPSAGPTRTVTIVTPESTDAFFAAVTRETVCAVDLETTSLDVMKAEIVGISVAAAGGVWYLPVGHDEGDNCDWDLLMPRLKTFLENTAIEKIGHNLKYDATILRRHGIELGPMGFDTMLAAYVLDPGSRSYGLKTLSETYLNHHMQPITELIGTGKNQQSFSAVDIERAAAYSGDDAAVTLALAGMFRERIDREGLGDLYRKVELPLMRVLMDMEMHGVLLDTGILADMSVDIGRQLLNKEQQIYEIAGEEFNINSPKQLGEILFNRLGLRTRHRTKTGYSTDIDTLTMLAADHPLPLNILEYRQLAKLKSTYIDSLPAMVNPETGRVHTSFNQAVAATGRLSSSDPNLQNIPIRTELGREIRKAFIVPPGFLLLSADYSQAELRIMAHVSGDALLREAFAAGEDVHRRTAALLFGVAPREVTPDQRRQAKTINFGVMYGMGAFALSEQLCIGRNEAAAFIEHYFATHTGVKAYIDRTVEEARRTGVVTTLLGRKRYVQDINSTNRNIAEFAKRAAINTPIQGSAADLIKVSMVDLARRLTEEKLNAAMVLQVHDELVLEVAEHDLDRVRTVVRETMEGALDLDVPLVVDIGVGPNWFEAH